MSDMAWQRLSSRSFVPSNAIPASAEQSLRDWLYTTLNCNDGHQSKRARRVALRVGLNISEYEINAKKELAEETPAADLADVIDAFLDVLPLTSEFANVDAGWKQQRAILQELLAEMNSVLRVRPDGRALEVVTNRTLQGAMKNIIFAGRGPKPEIFVRDALNNDIEITKNAEFWLVYNRPLTEAGLLWRDLVSWWGDQESMKGMDGVEVGRNLFNRLLECMPKESTGFLRENKAERFIFTQYCTRYRQSWDIPALIPQVHLHFDPYKRRAHRERMDFLLLLPHHRRIVIELDGRQHYANQAGHADPQRYAEMVAADRELRLSGYEVYRFGGAEITPGSPQTETLLKSFFDKLLAT